MNEYDALMKGDKVAHNEYDELLQQQTKANDTQARAAARKDLPPDTAAKIVDLADQTKLPRDVVERNLKAVDVDPRLNEYDQFLAHPVLRKYMADPYMQAAVKDDSTFGITDKLLNSLTRSVLNFQAGIAGTVTRVNDRFVKELDDLDQMLGAGTAPELIPDAKDTTGYRWMTPEQRADTRRRLEEARSTGIQNIETYLKIAAAVPAIDPVVARAVQAESASEFWEFFSQKPIEFILTIGAESAVQSLAIAAGTALSGGNPLVALGIAGAGSYGMEYGNSILQGLRNEGVNLSDRAAIEKAVQDKNMMKRVAKYAHSRAAPVALFDAVAAGRAAGVRNFRGVARNILEQGALGAAGEATAQVAEGKKELAFGEIAAEFFGEMVTAPIEVSGVTAAAYRQYMQAQEQKTFFEALGTHAENSKLRERLPEKFREMVEEMTKDGPIENVYIDPRAFTQYFQSQNIDPRKAARDILGSEAPLDQALSSGQDLQIPTGVYAAKVAGTKHNAALTQDLKFGPDAISAREAESLLEEARQRAKDEAEKAKTEEGKQTEETVQTLVSKQLQSAGYEASTADMLAKQMEAFFNAQAERTGRKGAMELFKEYALRILGRNDQTRMGPEIVSLDQSAYHGSPHVFDQFSTQHIGKGEGAQVHGWGLYFAKQKHTAKVRYRDRLAPIEITSFEQDNARGRFIKYGDFEYDIQMLETADLSTFLHESGHFYLEILKNLAKDSSEVKADLDVLLKWMGIESVDQIEVQHHEQFARGLEAYFMEGKAPNVELRSVFARFRAWLMALYARMSALDVRLNDDVRQVMDRMFATEQEIAAASRENQLVPVFTTAEAAGMRPEEFERYLATIQRANQKATEELQTELMQAWSREQQTWWREQRRIVRDEVLAARVQEPDVVAYYALRYGTSPDGTDLPSPIKLDRDSLVTMYGKDHAFIPTLRGLNMYRKDGGVHPDVAAPLFGFKSGDELVRAVINARGFQVEVDTKTDAVMKERYGDIMVDGTMADKARDAVMNDERAKILHAELKALTRLRNQVAPFVQEERNRQRAETSHGLAAIRGTPPLEVFQRLAKMRVGAMQVRSIKPNTFLVAARKAGIEAVEAATKNDFITAADAKQRELFNMEMYRVARNAVDETQKIVEYARSFSKTSVRQRLGHAGQDYVDQIDALVDRFDFRPTPVRDIDRRSRLADWIAQKERQGITVDLPDEIVNEAFKQHYKTLTFDQLQGVHDSLRHIDHLAKLKNKLIKSKDKRDLKVILDIIESTIRENAKKIDKNKTGVRLPQGEVGRFIDMFFASHRKMASYVRQMDGFEDGGALWTYLIQPLNDASAQEATMIHEAGLKLQELFKPYMTMKEEYKSAVTTLSLGLIEKGMYARQHVPSIGEPLSKMERLMVALNLGNDDNRTKLKAGYGWNDQQIQDIIAPLTKEDWDFVQGMWDFIDSYWPQIEAKEKRVNGIAPEKVEATPLQTPHGEYRGGYFPLKYEDRLAPKAYGDRAKEAAEQMIRGAYTQATTRRGHTKERVEGVKMPPRLDFGVIFEHTYQVVHDLSFHEYLIDANKILGSRQIQQAIIEAYGDQVYDQLRATLEDVAAGEVPAITAFEKSVNWLRQGTSIAAMGWNLTTALLQGLGLSQAIVRVGPEWVFKAFSRIFKDAGHLENSARWVHEKSEVIRNRHVTMAREINEIRNSIRGQTTVGVIGNSYFWLIAKGQQLVDIPTWIAMYEKAMHHGQTEERAIAMADQAVLDSQGGGQVKDLAQIQRGGPLMRLWTNFYSYFNVTYNLTAESFARTKIKDPLSVGRLAVDLLMLYSVPAVMGFFIKEGLRGDEPPEDLTKRLLREQASYVFGTMVGLREFSSVLNGFYGYEGPTGTRFYSETVKLIQQAEQGEVDEALLKSLNNAAGVLLHYPSGQVQRTVEGYAAWSEGAAGPQAVLLGKPQEAR